MRFLAWASRMIRGKRSRHGLRRVQATRDATFQEAWTTQDETGEPVQRRVNHTLAVGSLGGATMDNEWNYVHAKLMRSLGVVYVENQARI